MLDGSPRKELLLNIAALKSTNVCYKLCLLLLCIEAVGCAEGKETSSELFRCNSGEGSVATKNLSFGIADFEYPDAYVIIDQSKERDYAAVRIQDATELRKDEHFGEIEVLLVDHPKWRRFVSKSRSDLEHLGDVGYDLFTVQAYGRIYQVARNEDATHSPGWYLISINSDSAVRIFATAKWPSSSLCTIIHTLDIRGAE